MLPWSFASLRLKFCWVLRPCRRACRGRTCRGTDRPHPRGRRSQRTSSAHPPWVSHLRGCTGCCPAQPASWCRSGFVVQLQQLHVVGVGSLAVGGLQGLLNLGDDIVELGELLALLVGLAQADAHLLGGVVAHGVHDVAKEEQVKLALAIPVVDVTDLLNSISVNHFV